MPFCEKCGKEKKEDAKNCEVCTELEETMPQPEEIEISMVQGL